MTAPGPCLRKHPDGIVAQRAAGAAVAILVAATEIYLLGSAAGTTSSSARVAKGPA
jgi:hypothetical protein